MSDDFDKEAEREKLREQFEREEQKRQQTQRMSELLLKGATMTDHHCDVCGDPIFRYDGQEFCPTCRSEGRGGAANAAAGGDAAGDRRAGEGTPANEPASADRPGEQPAGNAAAPAGADGATGEAAGSDGDRTTASGGTADARTPRDSGEGAVGRSGRRPDTGDERSVERATLADGEAALVAALTRHARAAAETGDPRRARESLAAAREAAEALAALGR